MLFKQSSEDFSCELFQNPGACYRGAPFWSWNTLITKEMIEQQILQFKKMGMGGFHVHVRVGLRNKYLGDEFLELVRFCNEKAKENGMLCWLYDEDRYASGMGGGEVTKNVFFRSRWLKLTTSKDEEMLDSFEEFIEKQRKNEKVKGCFLKAYDIVIEAGYLKKASVINPNDEAEGVKWYLYIELAKESPWCNNQTYVDTLKPEAIESFINITHERYAQILQEDFGKSVPAIFTDEPRFNGLRLPDKAESLRDICLPYTESLPNEYGNVNGMDFFEAVPYLVWSCEGEKACMQRYHYYETLSRMFADAYCKKIGDWCEEHNLISTGHLFGEDGVRGQASNVGDAMRCYREFQMPGIDNLCDLREFSAAKQASSIAHQYCKEGVLSELYGVTQWDFDFEGYKLAGDWQAALGVNIRVPHLAWASMEGEAKRDYPAAIGWQSPWYEDYSYIENHFARVNYCLTRGKPVVHVGVLHTVESFWLLQGPQNQSEGKKRQFEDDFQNITNWLLTGGIDFDYISESSLADDESVQKQDKFCCGDMQYDVILIPSCINIRKTTLEKLIRFLDAGGRVFFMGDVPEYVDCLKNKSLERLVDKCGKISMSRQALLEKLNDWREVDFWKSGGKRAHNLLYQMRQEDNCRWLFVAQAYKGMEGRQDEIWYRRALHAPQNLSITIKGEWKVTKYDTLTGDVYCLKAEYHNNQTIVHYEMYGDDSLMLRLEPMERTDECIDEYTEEAFNNRQKIEYRYSLPEPVGYRMSEPNVLLLDYFEYALDDEEYQPRCEILKLDNLIRQRLHLPMRCESLAQPYIRIKEDVREHKVRLRTKFYSFAELPDCCLALEEAGYCRCTLNGEAVNMKPQGYYVDPAIGIVKLPTIQKGENELCLTIDYGDCTNLEWMYILGEFGVDLKGAHTSLYPKPEKLFWGDYTRQGFPFYTGNMTYIVNIPENIQNEEDKILQVPYFSGAAVKVSVDGDDDQMLAFLPYKCSLKERSKKLQITCLGNRYNGFGQLHLIGDDMYWLGQNSWRTEGTSWTDTYQVKSMGILTAPHIISES